MKIIISFIQIIKILKKKKWQDQIQLEVEGKFLKTKHYFLVKKWLVPKKLLKELGLEATMIDGPNTETPPRVTLNDLMKSMNQGFASVNKRLDTIENDVKILRGDMKLIKSLPTIQREIKELKK